MIGTYKKVISISIRDVHDVGGTQRGKIASGSADVGKTKRGQRREGRAVVRGSLVVLERRGEAGHVIYEGESDIT